MPCSRDYHSFFVSFCCQRCNREVEFNMEKRECGINDSVLTSTGNSLTIETKVFKCTTCKQEITMYFHCTPGKFDDDYIWYDDSCSVSQGQPKLMMYIQNVDK